MTRFCIIITLMVLVSCSGDVAKDQKFDSVHDSTAARLDNDCDSTLFPDFKNNLEDVDVTVLPQYLDEMRLVADSFITEQCAFDSLFCGEIYEKHLNLYRSPDGYELFSIGYAYVGSDSSMEPESASLFVFGVRKNGKTLFYEIEEDIVGEIQFRLEGFEVVGGKMILWGESLLYFAHEYGRFKLTVDSSGKKWEYMCRSVN